MVPAVRETGDRPSGSAELARAATVARRFYLDGMTKRDIGQQCGISRFKVARLLELAHERGLVHIEIDSPAGFDLDLADRLRERFGLGDVYVVEGSRTDQTDERERLGAAAAPVLADVVQDGEMLGVAWGRTLSAAIDHLPRLAASSVVQIAGGSASAYGDSPVDLVRRAAERFGLEPFLLHAPLFVGDPSTAAALRSDPATAATLGRFSELTTVVIGVGAWDPERSSVIPALSRPDLEALEVAGVAAESCGMFFTADGDPITTLVRDRTIGIGFEQLRSVPCRIGVAGGIGKATALEATLRAGLFTHLVTDRRAAAAIVDEEPDGSTGQGE